MQQHQQHLQGFQHAGPLAAQQLPLAAQQRPQQLPLVVEPPPLQHVPLQHQQGAMVGPQVLGQPQYSVLQQPMALLPMQANVPQGQQQQQQQQQQQMQQQMQQQQWPGAPLPTQQPLWFRPPPPPPPSQQQQQQQQRQQQWQGVPLPAQQPPWLQQQQQQWHAVPAPTQQPPWFQQQQQQQWHAVPPTAQHALWAEHAPSHHHNQYQWQPQHPQLSAAPSGQQYWPGQQPLPPPLPPPQPVPPHRSAERRPPPLPQPQQRLLAPPIQQHQQQQQQRFAAYTPSQPRTAGPRLTGPQGSHQQTQPRQQLAGADWAQQMQQSAAAKRKEQQQAAQRARQQKAAQHAELVRWQKEQAAEQKERKRLERLAAIVPFPQFLQLPTEVIAAVAEHLPWKERMKLGRLVLPKAAPAAAAAILSTITSLQNKQHQPLHNLFAVMAPLTNLKQAQLNVQLSKPRDAKKGMTKKQQQQQQQQPMAADIFAAAAAAQPALPSLAGLTALTRLDITAASSDAERSWHCHGPLGPAERTGHQARQLAAVQAVGTLTQLSQLRFSIVYENSWSQVQPPAAGVFSALCGLTGLKSLELEFQPSFQPLGLEEISTLTGLTALHIHCEKQMRAEDVCYHAHSFVSGKSVMPALEKVWSQLQLLQSLQISSTRWMQPAPQESVSALQFPEPGRLTALRFSSFRELFPSFTQQLLLTTALQRLELPQCAGLSADDLAAVAPALAGSLTYLDFSRLERRLQGDFMSAVGQLKGLAHLNALGSETTGVAASSWKSLSNLTRLTYLALGIERPSAVPPVAVACLTTLQQLKSVQLYGPVFAAEVPDVAKVFGPLASTLTCLELLYVTVDRSAMAPAIAGSGFCRCSQCFANKLEDELLRLMPRAQEVVVEMDDVAAGPWHEGEDLWDDEGSDLDDFHEYDDWNEMEAEAVFWHFM